jgi:hypothetical protein
LSTNADAVMEVDRSVIDAAVAVRALTSTVDARFGASKIIGTIEPGAASLTCVYVYDENYAPLDSSCQ